MDNGTFLAVDFETANAKRVSACSLGVCKYVAGKLEMAKSFLIKPVGDYAPMNVRIHGITPDMTENSPTFDKIFPLLRESFETMPVLGYSSFDKSVINSVVEHYGLPLAHPIDYVDVCCYAKRLLPELPNHKLPTVSGYFNLGSFRHHDAFDDAAKCAEIYLKLLELDGLNPVKPVCHQEDVSMMNRSCTGESSAFVAYVESILLDGVVDYKEANELLCVLRMLSSRNKIFADLEVITESIVEDGVVDEDESGRLAQLLTGVSELLAGKLVQRCPQCGNPVPDMLFQGEEDPICPWCCEEFQHP